jgi:hypothetical protein
MVPLAGKPNTGTLKEIPADVRVDRQPQQASCQMAVRAQQAESHDDMQNAQAEQQRQDALGKGTTLANKSLARVSG